MNPWLWSDSEERILREMLEQGKSFEDVAAVINRPLTGIMWKAHRLKLRDVNRTTRNRGATQEDLQANRDCMSCQRPFHSEGIHNRLCRYCKSLSQVNDFPCEVRF